MMLLEPKKSLVVVRRIVVRHLDPPPPRASVTLGPHEMRWQVVNPDGRVILEGEQHNLVLNQTWDSLIPQYGFDDLSQYAVVGTGSTEPDPNQTGLVAEVARTNTGVSGQSDTLVRVADGVYERTRYREFTEAQVGGQNLTEWGWSPSSTSGNNLMCRELFRDANGTPITLTLAADQRLRLIYKTRITLSPISAPHAISINGLGNFTGTVNLYGGGFIDFSLANAWAKGDALYVAVDSLQNPNWSYASNATAVSNPSVKQVTPLAYGGNYQRIIPAVTFSNSEANQTITRIFLARIVYVPGYNPSVEGLGFQFWLNTPFTKDNLHKLTIGQWVLTWGP